MLFTITFATLVSTFVTAAPAPQTSSPNANENIAISDLLVRRYGPVLDVVDFKLNG